jgi:hypothetical protein
MADGVTHHLLHVGSAQTFPRIKRPAEDSATWKTMLREGEVVEQNPLRGGMTSWPT